MTIPKTITANYKFAFDVLIEGIENPSASTYTLTLRGPATYDTVGTYESGYAAFASVVVVAGTYKYAITATDSNSVRTLIDTGMITVERDPTAIANDTDLRTHPQKVLDSINAVIENRATKDQASYTIAGRSLTKTPIADLLLLQTAYEKKVANYGRKLPRAILTRFGPY